MFCELQSLLGFFASFGLSTELVAQILQWSYFVSRPGIQKSCKKTNAGTTVKDRKI
jgi:hypothetical protein